MLTSARPSRSVQSLSPVVIGRLITASTHSSVPAGSKETAPPAKLKRAARAGGSSSSAAAAILGFARKESANKAVKSVNHLAALFLIFDLSCSAINFQVSYLATCKMGLGLASFFHNTTRLLHLCHPEIA